MDILEELKSSVCVLSEAISVRVVPLASERGGLGDVSPIRTKDGVTGVESTHREDRCDDGRRKNRGLGDDCMP